MQKMAEYVLSSTTGKIVEIGAGNGEFARLCNSDRYVAYEPTDDWEKCAQFCETRQRYFVPESGVPVEKPGLLLMRHVLEHYAKPGEFLQQLSRACKVDKCEPYLIIEVPNIVPALRHLRIEDWVYEHPQHFTPESLAMLARLHGWTVDDMYTTYNDEVIIARFVPQGAFKLGRKNAFDRMQRWFQETREELLMLHKKRHGSVVLWGGAGKGSTLINMLDLPFRSLPIVDSDERKWGKCVPGTAHLIETPAILRSLKPDLVVVTTSWRVGDIREEIKLSGLPVGHVASINQGHLVYGV